MPEEKGPIPYIDLINAGLGQVIIGLPIALAAYKILHAMLKHADPAMTFEQYNARLAANADDVVDFAQNWFAAHGYVKQADGSWRKTETPAA